MSEPYGKVVVKREHIELSDRRLHRKTWDNGYVDTYYVHRTETNSRGPITNEEWAVAQQKHPIANIEWVEN